VAADYAYAVRDGAVLSDLEYAEMLRLTRELVESAAGLRGQGASPGVESALAELLERVLARAPARAVHELALDTALGLIDGLGLEAAPEARPDLRRGRRLFAANCAPCHGRLGGGDGLSAPGMEPPPASFRDPRMNRVSPHQAYGATTFGVPGTAMPSFGEALSAQRIWDLSFFVMTLRADFDPRPSTPPPPLALADLALSSNRDLLTRHPALTPSQLDQARLHPPHP